MPSTATITSFYSFSPNTVIKSAEVNNNFNLFRGHFIPIDPNTATGATTKTYDLGASDHYWRNSYVGFMTADTVTASTIVGTTITATTLVATNATVGSLVATTITATSLVTTNATITNTITSLSVGNFIATTITATSLVATTLTATTVVATSLTVSDQINLTGGKVKFPASQSASADANTLDDYEEGTFTPTIFGTGTAGTGTYGTQKGRYTKIGNMVYVDIELYWTAHTGTGNLRVGGLPFTSNATYYACINVGDVAGFAYGATSTLAGYVLVSTTNIKPVAMLLGGASDTDVAMTSNVLITFTCIYAV